MSLFELSVCIVDASNHPSRTGHKISITNYVIINGFVYRNILLALPISVVPKSLEYYCVYANKTQDLINTRKFAFWDFS